jgi:hypothetical protein
MKKLSALLKILMLFATSDCYTVRQPAATTLHSENVRLKPNTYWYHELTGKGVMRVVTDFQETDAKIYPMVLDLHGLEKCKRGEPYMPVDLDGRTPLCPQWSHTVFFGDTDKTYYIVMRNEDNREHSFRLLMYPS